MDNTPLDLEPCVYNITSVLSVESVYDTITYYLHDFIGYENKEDIQRLFDTVAFICGFYLWEFEHSPIQEFQDSYNFEWFKVTIKGTDTIKSREALNTFLLNHHSLNIINK